MSSEGVLDEFARNIDVRTLSTDQFVQLLETLHMLDTAGAGVTIESMSTAVLAEIVSRASKDQLKSIADHPRLRAVFLDEVFRRMSDHFLPDKAQYVNLVVGWRFPKDEDSYDRFQTVIEDGVCVSSSNGNRSPDTTITVAAEDFLRMATGNAAIARMFVTGKVKVKGEYAPALRLSTYFDIPKAG